MLSTFAEFGVDLVRMRTCEGMAVTRAKGKLKGKQPKLSARQQARLVRLHLAETTTSPSWLSCSRCTGLRYAGCWSAPCARRSRSRRR
jgi:DNA invertase Pin-like site-specific DNA recombinase